MHEDHDSVLAERDALRQAVEALAEQGCEMTKDEAEAWAESVLLQADAAAEMARGGAR